MVLPTRRLASEGRMALESVYTTQVCCVSGRETSFPAAAAERERVISQWAGHIDGLKFLPLQSFRYQT